MNLNQEGILNILANGTPSERVGIWSFGPADDELTILEKFGWWRTYLFPRFFKSPDAPFHREMDLQLVRAYLGMIDSFANIGFRGLAKTTRLKLFTAFVITNDLKRRRKYLKILSYDGDNSKQFVTDIYNLLVDPLVKIHYTDTFLKTDAKREETMASFTTAHGVKLVADTVGTSQRGQIQEETRPDWVIFDDFETRMTLSSAIITKRLWDNMEEARTGLSKGGVTIYNAQYLSERGNVHKIVLRDNPKTPVMITPIVDSNGKPTWPARYTVEEVMEIKRWADDFEGEYLCRPSSAKDVLFDRLIVESQNKIEPIKISGGFKIFKKYNPSHRYASGHDVAGGVGLDSSTSVFIDFDSFPAQVVGTYHDNDIKPDDFGDEIAREGREFGECLVAPEKNNHGHATIGRLKQIYPLERLYKTQREDVKVLNVQNMKWMEYGWETNSVTKTKMIFALVKAVNDGHLSLNDQDLINEAKYYTRNDLMDKNSDPRLATNHFDLLMATAIAWQMKEWATLKEKPVSAPQQPYQPISEYERTDFSVPVPKPEPAGIGTPRINEDNQDYDPFGGF